MKRKIAVIIMYDIFLTQCIPGLRQLIESQNNNLIEILGIFTVESLKNKADLMDELEKLSDRGADYIIAMDSGPYHLAFIISDYLMRDLKNDKAIVMPVIYEDFMNLPASAITKFSIEYATGVRVHCEGEITGEEGFRKACLLASEFKVLEFKQVEKEPAKPELFKKRNAKDALIKANLLIRQEVGV